MAPYVDLKVSYSRYVTPTMDPGRWAPESAIFAATQASVNSSAWPSCHPYRQQSRRDLEKNVSYAYTLRSCLASIYVNDGSWLANSMGQVFFGDPGRPRRSKRLNYGTGGYPNRMRATRPAKSHRKRPV